MGGVIIETKSLIQKHTTFIISICILAIAAVLYLFTRPEASEELFVVVTVDGECLYSYPLNEDRTTKITSENGYNILCIEKGTAYIREADCSNQVCVYTRKIFEPGHQIVCLPHKLIVFITTDQ